jgi:hypothetical protein
MEKRKMICFDMDGSINRFYDVPNWLPKLQAEDASPYLEAKPLWDMRKLNKILLSLKKSGWEIRIVTWLAKNSSPAYDAKVREAKKQWLIEMNFPYDHLHMIKYGRNKASCVRAYTDNAVLIDDNAGIRKGWHLGATIDPTSCNLLDELQKLA